MTLLCGREVVWLLGLKFNSADGSVPVQCGHPVEINSCLFSCTLQRKQFNPLNDIIQYHLCRPGVNCVYGGVGLSGEGVWLNNARYWRQQRRSMKFSPYHMPYTLGEGSYTHT